MKKPKFKVGDIINKPRHMSFRKEVVAVLSGRYRTKRLEGSAIEDYTEYYSHGYIDREYEIDELLSSPLYKALT